MVAERISAVIDERAPGGFETVKMTPQQHPLWRPWADLAGKKIPVTTFAEFVMQNRRAIIEPDGKTLAFMLSQVRATVSVEIQKGRGKDAINGSVVKTSIQGQETKEVVEIPDEITIRVPLYVGTGRKDIELDLCVEAERNGEVYVVVSAGTLAEARVKAFEEMVATIREAIEDEEGGGGATITYGSPEHGEWKYLPELPPTPPK